MADVLERARRESIIHWPRVEGTHCTCGSRLPCITTELLAEVERLREELTNEDYEDVTRERDEARAEVERLRALLKPENDARLSDLVIKAWNTIPRALTDQSRALRATRTVLSALRTDALDGES